jgi:hypothetical protein
MPATNAEMTRRFRPHIARLVVAAVVGIAYPHAELAWKCRAGATSSEACVWGRSYMPLSEWVEPLIIGPVVFVLFTVLAYLLSRRHENNEPQR